MSGFAAIAWDVDGTLVNSEPLHHHALMLISARYGVAIAVDDDRFVGMAMDDVWNNVRPLHPAGTDRAIWLDEINTAFVAGSATLRPVPGVITAMRSAQHAGLRQCCVSNSARQVVEASLVAIGASPFIEFSISRDDVAVGKPDPEPYRAACSRLGLPAAAVLAVEDSETGAASARAAGCQLLLTDAAGRGLPSLLGPLAEPALDRP